MGAIAFAALLLTAQPQYAVLQANALSTVHARAHPPPIFSASSKRVAPFYTFEIQPR